MKTKVALLLSLALLLPLGTSAQTPPPHPDFAAMRAMMQQTRALRESERGHILGALLPAHREYLASVIGQLAIAEKPDPKAAAAQLDAKLSSNEKEAILSAHSSFRDQMMALRKQMSNPEGQQRQGHRQHTPDAGRILLEIAGFGESHETMGGRGMHHAGLPPA